MTNKNDELRRVIAEAVDEMMDGKSEEELNELFSGLGALGRSFGSAFKKGASDAAKATVNKVASTAKTMGDDYALSEQEAAMANAYRLAKTMRETLTTKLINDRAKFGEFQIKNAGKGVSTEEMLDGAIEMVGGGLKTIMDTMRMEIGARRSKLSYTKKGAVDGGSTFGDKLSGALDAVPMGDRPRGKGLFENKKAK